MSPFTNKLENQTVIILGGSGGVGMGIASGLLSYNANVIITASRQSSLDSKLKTLRSTYPNTKPSSLTGFTCDLASPTDAESNIATLVTAVKAHLKENLNDAPLNHFIFAAGDSLPLTPIEEITQAKFHAALQVRATSCILSVKAFLPLLPRSNKSSVTLTCGAICDKPIPGGWSMLAFLASGINGLARNLASDLAPIRVNSVAPGVVDTDLWSGMKEDERKEFYAKMAADLPTGDVGHADDVAEVYLYLMRDANVTGSTMHTNGGSFL